MRKTTFVALAIVIASCSAEKASEKSVVTAVPVSMHRKSPVDIKMLYDVLKKNGLVKKSLSQTKISFISDQIIDVNEANSPKYVAALVEPRGERSTIIAVFDPSQNMNLVAHTKQDFPDVISYIDGFGNERVSGQGPNLVARALKLSDAGDVISINAKSEKQYVKGSEDDEDVWLFAFWKNDVVMLMGYPKNFTHLVSNDNGYAVTRRLDTQFIITPNKTRGLHDVILKTSIAEGSAPRETTEVSHIFNGVEYIQK